MRSRSRPIPTLIRVLLGQALVDDQRARLLDEAITNLRTALQADSEIPDAYDHLAMAYGRKSDLADADLASAQAAFNRGNFPTARQLASRAKGRFPIGSPGWVKADDIASYKPPQRRSSCLEIKLASCQRQTAKGPGHMIAKTIEPRRRRHCRLC